MGVGFHFQKPCLVGRKPSCGKCRRIIERGEIFLRVYGFQSQGNLCVDCSVKGFNGEIS